MIYASITAVVLLVLNLYCSAASQKIFYQSKEASMIEKAQLAAAEIGSLEVLSPSAAATAVNQMSSLKVTRLIITDQSGLVIYDSLDENAVGKYALLPQIVEAMEGNDVFTWHYHDSAMRSEAATPVVSYGIIVGCVYMMEYDTEQGALIGSLQTNILTITLILEIIVVLFSLIFSRVFSGRMEKIMNSMRIIQEGDYSHQVSMGGHDELTFLADEFNDLTQRLQTSESKRRQFVSDALHELKTPLASIELLADSILHNDMDIDTIREFVGDIRDEADRLNRMTQKLLDLTRGETAAEDESREIMYITPTVERVVRMLSTQAEAVGVRINVTVRQDAPILMREDDLYQIIFNLVENGIKYNVPHGTLDISINRNEEYGILKIADTGVGIPEDALGHIFERFYRVDKARSRATGGSGLGLSIVRNMLERNQSQIHVESTLGLGTTFTVEFPAFDTEEDSQ